MLRMKRFFHFTSIRHKLMAIVMATSAAVLILASLAFIVNEALTFRRQMHQELTALAGIIGINTTAAITFGDRKAAAKTLEGLGARPHILSAYILTQDGEIFAKYIAPGAAPGRLKMEHREGDASYDRRPHWRQWCGKHKHGGKTGTTTWKWWSRSSRRSADGQSSSIRSAGNYSAALSVYYGDRHQRSPRLRSPTFCRTSFSALFPTRSCTWRRL
jgi:hypothetical protein